MDTHKLNNGWDTFPLEKELALFFVHFQVVSPEILALQADSKVFPCVTKVPQETNCSRLVAIVL